MEALHRNSPPLPFNETERLRALLDSCILDTQQDPAFDAITRAASVLMETPIAAVSLIDQHRQWFKSAVGLAMSDTSREDAFCAYAILQREPLIVLDARRDARFAGNRFVTGEPGVRFYVGVPVRSEDGLPLGTLFVTDFTPRTTVDLRLLQMLCDLAETVESMIRVRRTTQYVDRASGLPNQRRFQENAASLRATALLSREGGNDSDPGVDASADASSPSSARVIAEPLRGWSSSKAVSGDIAGGGAQASSEYWAVCVEGVTAACADDWIARGKATRIDQQLEGVATWLRSAAVTRDGVYRLSARHLAFFVMMPHAAVSRLLSALSRDLMPIIGVADSAGEMTLGTPRRRHDAPGARRDVGPGKTPREGLNASIGERQLVALNVCACDDVAGLITALIAPRTDTAMPVSDTSPDVGATPLHRPNVQREALPLSSLQADRAHGAPLGATIHALSARTPGVRVPDRSAPAGVAAVAARVDGARPRGPEAAWGTALRSDVSGTGYDPAQDGCQMRVNLCVAVAEGFTITVPEHMQDGDVLALHGAGLQEAAAPTGGFRGTAGAADVTLGVAQRRALLDWFSRWWTMERRTSARLQLRGGLALLDQSPQQWLNDLLHVGLLPAQLEVAVPLAALREQFATTQRRVRVWREAGIGVVITGFGAGFDTVRWLPTLPLTGVSFDPRVIDAVRQLPKHARVVQRLVSLAHALGMRVGVDGLQDEGALRIARGLGIDEGSGDATARVLAVQDGGGVVPRIDSISTQDETAALLGRLDPQGAATTRDDAIPQDRTADASRRSTYVLTQPHGKTASGRSTEGDVRRVSATDRRGAAPLRVVRDDAAESGCQHGDTCTAGCIPSRTATRDSIIRASMYPRFRFQS